MAESHAVHHPMPLYVELITGEEMYTSEEEPRSLLGKMTITRPFAFGGSTLLGPQWLLCGQDTRSQQGKLTMNEGNTGLVAKTRLKAYQAISHMAN